MTIPELWRDIDRVQGTPHMNWGECVCTQCSIWRIVAALQEAQKPRCDWDCDTCAWDGDDDE